MNPKVFLADHASTIAFLKDFSHGDNPQPINGKMAFGIISDYGRELYKQAHPGEGIALNLAIVIDENRVYICPSQDGPNGVFLGRYSENEYPIWAERLTKNTIWEFSNIQAKLDGMAFFADVIACSWKTRSINLGETNGNF